MKHYFRDILLTCEHATNVYPKEFEFIFKNRKRLLKSHRGWDIGAIEIARAISKEMDVTLVEGEYSRLLIDLNRSLNHPNCFSEFTRTLPQTVKENIIVKHYIPFRNATEKILLGQEKTIHLSIHSFVPILAGIERNCDIGILYDPKNELEKTVADKLKIQFQKSFECPRLRMNYPYKGYSNGHTTDLRKKYSSDRYIGLEIEFNQAWLKKSGTPSMIASSISKAIASL